MIFAVASAHGSTIYVSVTATHVNLIQRDYEGRQEAFDMPLNEFKELAVKLLFSCYGCAAPMDFPLAVRQMFCKVRCNYIFGVL